MKSFLELIKGSKPSAGNIEEGDLVIYEHVFYRGYQGYLTKQYPCKVFVIDDTHIYLEWKRSPEMGHLYEITEMEILNKRPMIPGEIQNFTKSNYFKLPLDLIHRVTKLNNPKGNVLLFRRKGA